MPNGELWTPSPTDRPHWTPTPWHRGSSTLDAGLRRQQSLEVVPVWPWVTTSRSGSSLHRPCRAVSRFLGRLIDDRPSDRKMAHPQLLTCDATTMKGPVEEGPSLIHGSLVLDENLLRYRFTFDEHCKWVVSSVSANPDQPDSEKRERETETDDQSAYAQAELKR